MSQEPMSPSITDDDKLWAALSYITMYIPFGFPVAAIVNLVWEEKKNRPYIKVQAVQSIALWVVILGLSFIGVGLCLAPIVFFASLYWAYQAYQGQDIQIPMISDFIKNQGWA